MKLEMKTRNENFVTNDETSALFLNWSRFFVHGRRGFVQPLVRTQHVTSFNAPGATTNLPDDDSDVVKRFHLKDVG